MMTVTGRIAAELSVQGRQVEAAVRLLDDGATVPFIARYRKEVTEGLDDTQLRTLEKRLAYLRELEERRATVLRSLEEQGQLSDALRAAVLAAETQTRLEDLYRPYRPKRRTKAQIARAAGLAPLAERLLAKRDLAPALAAAQFVDAEKGVPDAESALEGARQILIERFADDAELVGRLREYLWQHATLASRVVRGQEEAGAKFADYFDAGEPLRAAPSHRALALLRGRNEAVLRLSLALAEDDGLAAGALGAGERMIAAHAAK